MYVEEIEVKDIVLPAGLTYQEKVTYQDVHSVHKRYPGKESIENSFAGKTHLIMRTRKLRFERRHYD